MRVLLFYCVAGILSSALASPTENWIVGQEVLTTSGKVKGSPATRKGYQQVSQYVGIPFAEAPVGPLRWAAPKPFRGTGTIDGTKWKDDCSQPTGAASIMNSNKNLAEYSQGMGGKNHILFRGLFGIEYLDCTSKG
jgi:hypothetical protein